MPTRIFAIRDRLRQDVAAVLSPRTIEAACETVGYRWRECKFGPVETIFLFLVQVFLGNTSRKHMARLVGREFTDTAYCKARSRLPPAIFLELVPQVASAGSSPACGSAARSSTLS